MSIYQKSFRWYLGLLEIIVLAIITLSGDVEAVTYKFIGSFVKKLKWLR